MFSKIESLRRGGHGVPRLQILICEVSLRAARCFRGIESMRKDQPRRAVLTKTGLSEPDISDNRVEPF